MSQVNLLPPDVLKAQRFRQLTGLVAAVGALVLLVIVGLYFMQVQNLSSVNGDIEDKETTNAGLQAQVASLQKYADLQTEAQEQTALLSVAYAGEVSFASQLMDLSRVIPSDVYFTDLAVQLTATSQDTTATATTAETPTGVIGAISGNGNAASFDTIATFLDRMETVKGWANPWVQTLGRSPETGLVAYTIGTDLTAEAETPRGKVASAGA